MPLSEAEAAHLLRRVCVGGGSDAEIAHFAGRSRTSAVNEIINDALTAPMPPHPNWNGLGSPWAEETATIGWWIDQMNESAAPLREKMAWFWHGHFCTEEDKIYNMNLIFEQNQLFRSAGLGNFRDLVQTMAIQPAMLIYLDNETNTKGAEQENFARELMELFTIGRENYTEADVIAMAKAWTGHNTVGWVEVNGTWQYVPHYTFKSELHDNSQKTLFGKTRNWNGPGTINEICNGAKKVQCSEFIAAKLWRFFVHPDPSPALVRSLGQRFRAVNLNIAELIRHILLHNEFWAPSARYALVKSPVEFLATVLKRTGVEIDANGRRWYLQGMGQVPFDPPDVAGWGANEDWLSTATAWGRARLLEHTRWQLDDLGHLRNLENAGGNVVANRVFELLGITEPSAQTRAVIRDWVDEAHAIRVQWSITPQAYLLGALSPDFQLN
ncbi:MAG: DUF1800 domain-containing protein [Acidimicrobiia bacterium]|nr:DUF1800 domain-containing protein [Acidimicrobiia bacterium]